MVSSNLFFPFGGGGPPLERFEFMLQQECVGGNFAPLDILGGSPSFGDGMDACSNRSVGERGLMIH